MHGVLGHTRDVTPSSAGLLTRLHLVLITSKNGFALIGLKLRSLPLRIIFNDLADIANDLKNNFNYSWGGKLVNICFALKNFQDSHPDHLFGGMYWVSVLE